jgi:hypothetical protein
MRVDWSPLAAELSLWRRDGLSLPIWWRDDDAVADTPALARLAKLSSGLGVPVHVAVIPDLIEASLPVAMAQMPMLIPVVHGWRHISHAPADAKNAEFGQMRETATAELAQGLARLTQRFGAALLPVFVPPWNRIDAVFMPILATAGYQGVSTYGPRAAPFAAAGLHRINTHIDPILWRGDRGLVSPDILLAGLVSTLRDRRGGRTDATEPLGLLTHHLAHTEAVWGFTGDVLRVLLEGGAVPADLRAFLLSA